MSNKARISRLEVANYKRISEVAVDIDGHVIVGGNNAQGKSSLLDSVEAALLGGAKVAADPVHHGADKAEIKVTLDNGLVVERTIGKDRKTKLKISEGKGGTTPQRWLDQHLNAVTLDPLAILALSPKDKANKLREISGVDTDKFDAAYKEAFDARTEIKRRLRDAEARLSAFPPFCFELANYELPSIEELTNMLDDAHDSNTRRENALRSLEAARGEHAAKKEELERAERRVEIIKSELEALVARGKALNAEASSIKPIDTVPISRQIAKHNATSLAKQEQKQRVKVDHEVQELKRELKAAEDAIKSAEQARRDALDSASWPLPGLSIDNGEVTYQGVPLEQASQAQQLRVAVALAAASKPDIGVVLVRDGCRLDDASLKLLLEEVTSAGLQAFVERVGVGDKGAIIIEDGRVAVGKEK